jgi:hypothetical protein
LELKGVIEMHRTILGFVALLASGCAALACGTERWPVKVGTDRDARKVIQPQATTIEQLISIAAPAHPESRRNTRFAPTELTTFQIKGVLKVIKKEIDQDYHFVIVDPANLSVTMIVESPDPKCASGSQFLNSITSGPTMLDRTLQLDRAFVETARSEQNMPVTVTGVDECVLKTWLRLSHQRGPPSHLARFKPREGEDWRYRLKMVHEKGEIRESPKFHSHLLLRRTLG